MDMLKITRQAACLSLGVLAVLCAAGRAAEQPLSDEEKVVLARAADAQTAFAMDLYGFLANLPHPQKPIENIFFSPSSISTAMAIVYAGSQGQTETQFCDALHFWTPQESFHDAMGRLEKRLNEQGRLGDCDLTSVNALWMDKRAAVQDSFLQQVSRFYSAHLQQVDFAQNPAAACQLINSWVQTQTHDRIQNLIDEGALDALTRLVVTNAVYFKGKWALPFDPEATHPDRFIVSVYTFRDGRPQTEYHKVEVQMMTRKGIFGYQKNDICQILELPYLCGDLRMVILLPNDPELYRLEHALNPKTLSEWLAVLRPQEVEVHLPRFTMTYACELKQALASLGLSSAFTAAADFSGITGGKDFFISDVVHKAFIQVDEEGTEAAAATGAVMKLVSVAEPPPIFRVDRPFLFLIQDKPTGAPLFFGRVTDPTKD